MEQKRGLTQRRIQDAKYWGKKPGAHCILLDDKVRGLGLRVYESGQKSFILTYFSNGQRKRMVLGALGPLSLEDARKKANQELGKVAEGADPLAEKQKVSGGCL